METGQAKVLELYSRGMTQTEIAHQLGLSQSVVSKDLKRMRKRVKEQVEDIVSDGKWDFGLYLSGCDAAISKLWEIAEDKEVPPKNRIEALKWIMEYYDERVTNTLMASQYFKPGKKDGVYGR